jgi:hypothetical protein
MVKIPITLPVLVQNDPDHGIGANSWDRNMVRSQDKEIESVVSSPPTTDKLVHVHLTNL